MTTAYQRGVSDAHSEATIESVMKMNPQEVQDAVVASAADAFPDDVSTTNVVMDGWTLPAGNETYGQVNVSMCYTGHGVEGNKTAYSSFVSDDANTVEPTWIVDAVHLTQEECDTRGQGSR